MTWLGWGLVSANILAIVVYGVVAWRLERERQRLRSISEVYVSLPMAQGIALWDEKQ